MRLPRWIAFGLAGLLPFVTLAPGYRWFCWPRQDDVDGLLTLTGRTIAGSFDA